MYVICRCTEYPSVPPAYPLHRHVPQRPLDPYPPHGSPVPWLASICASLFSLDSLHGSSLSLLGLALSRLARAMPRRASPRLGCSGLDVAEPPGQRPKHAHTRPLGLGPAQRYPYPIPYPAIHPAAFDRQARLTLLLCLVLGATAANSIPASSSHPPSSLPVLGAPFIL
ncbi:hypothetical protein TARUN_9327 [Trichoderma arundinaceum]|uniref:Uncharacterized protein n=1 Tax=Trichoderma arundinaceum TaxID=490622 RepID=A0A395NA02_TRIAR|nr:hypothetical protein TARUN_9327 [Trichoderma arundinaceum]